MNSFSKKVIEIVKNIPRGSTMSYSEIAKLAGSEKAARAVGSLMRKNSDINIPCHRVVRSDGTIGPYNGLRGSSKKEILEKEGCIFVANKISLKHI